MNNHPFINIMINCNIISIPFSRDATQQKTTAIDKGDHYVLNGVACKNGSNGQEMANSLMSCYINVKVSKDTMGVEYA